MKKSTEDIAFMQGYVMACSCIVSSNGEMVQVTEALQAYGKIDWSKIDAHDRMLLASTRRELDRKARLKP